jgi:hypothetical protein
MTVEFPLKNFHFFFLHLSFVAVQFWSYFAPIIPSFFGFLVTIAEGGV